MMSSKLGYEIVESDSRGKIVVAARDFLPGDTVLEEKEPLLFLPKDLLQQYMRYDSSECHIFLAAFSTFTKKLALEKKAQLLSLYGPTNGASANNIRELARNVHFSPNENSAPRLLTEDEVEIFVKIASVMRLNMFGFEDGKLVFGEITRFAHSCSANCAYDIHGKSIWCRTIKHIAAGEELTISYVCERNALSTHVRRQKYLDAKDFTCHCPRCDAPGDDTRQFDCIDPACKGVMMVCQPVNKEPLFLPDLHYTGVEYVEPHLLPCTECRRAAPVAYQNQMLALEARLPALVDEFVKRQAGMVSKTGMGMDRYDRLLKEIESLKLPMRHQLCLPIHNITMKMHRFNFMVVTKHLKQGDADQCRAAVQRAAADYIAAQEGITPGANSNFENILSQACHDCIIEWQDPRIGCPCIFPPLQAKEMLQRLLRVKLIRRPRSAPRDEKVDNALLKVLEDLPALKSTDLCAFCEESPLRAAITLSRCGKCKKVCYCSAGCQKAHWKLHKKTCKGEVK